jgi:hypothetical protein
LTALAIWKAKIRREKIEDVRKVSLQTLDEGQRA